MVQRRFFSIRSLLLLALIALFSAGCTKEVKKRAGNVEIITVTSRITKKVKYSLVYTYAGKNIVRGEYWEPFDPKKEKENKAKVNKLRNSAVGKKFAKMLRERDASGTPGAGGPRKEKVASIKLGMIRRFIKEVVYDGKGRPVTVRSAGLKDVPYLGRFEILSENNYTYNKKGLLTNIKEKNSNVDSAILSMGIGSITGIEYDAKDRPIKVSRALGTVPPTVETTAYTYADESKPFLKETKFEKIGITAKSLIGVTEEITIQYKKEIPWKGEDKYSFRKAVANFTIRDPIANKIVLDYAGIGTRLLGLFKLGSIRETTISGMVDKTMGFKNIYSVIDNERLGPRWRMGELPDVPQPFLIYGKYTWW